MSNKIFVAVNDTVFIKETETTATKQGGLIVPDSLNNDFLYGEVISVAEGYWYNGSFIPACVAVGDNIAVHKSATTKVTMNGMQLLMVHLPDIVAKEVEGFIDKK